MPSLCCFWCPKSDFAERSPGEECPSCGRDYQAPLINPPAKIGDYRVEQPLSRGFYGAAYRARQESLQRVVVLKIVPAGIYDLFKKDWASECREHANLAAGSPFVANILDQFSTEVDLLGSPLRCHVAVLENIAGETLEQLLSTQNLTPRSAAQVAADLFEILHLFAQHSRFHNDLHGGNIIVQRLTPQTVRSGAIDPMVRAVAIDLGSVLDASKSDKKRLGDEHHIAKHMVALARVVHQQTRSGSDTDARLAGVLRGFAEHLSAPPAAQRIITMDDALRSLRAAMAAVDEPWRQPLSLHRFNEAYNAQVLESWHVPELWFDPRDQWLPKTTARGPQVITGMRGCGKTMLLRALHFHARATQATRERSLTKLEGDDFVGLYSSCQKLLNPQDHDVETIFLPFERLFVAYLRDAVQVLRHLRSIDQSALLGGIDDLLKDALSAIELPEGFSAPHGEHEFELFLADLQFGLADGKVNCRLRMAPADAFGHLASVVRNAAPTLARKYVLFLLDDVSTRYLDAEMVREVISKLLFQHPHCAFRITTEAQALHRVLLSPGGSAPADPSRDYEEFNLGNEVYRLLQEGSTRDAMNFVAEILRRRGKQFQDELYRCDPMDVMGDEALETIASEIVSTSRTSNEKKRVYRGLRALQAVCVGDLGDVVKLYEKILQRADARTLPVDAEKQCDCFLEHSASLMHFLNRRDQQKKGLALAFAQAAGDLLRLSKNPTTGGTRRLRQYTKLYVRVDAGADFENVANRLLDLLDAGVFVYDGGVPRTKTRDDDPVLQFKLSYRKMLDLASFIGLSDRDRFELSGDTLRRWLEHPDEAKSILIDSVAKRAADAEQASPTADDDAADVSTGDEPSPAPPAAEAEKKAGGGRKRRKESSEQLTLGISSDEKREVRVAPSLLSRLLARVDNVVVDTSGLSKPYLFVAIRDALRRSRRVGVVHTLAEHHYPKNDDLLKLGVVAEKPVASDLLGRLQDVLMGEAGPYRLVRVHHSPSGPERWRSLLASASPKNDRLLHLLDSRPCDATRIFVPPPTTPRRRIAWAAAELAASAADANVALVQVDTNDIDGALRATEEVYNELYYQSGANVEIGLTGSKVHAVAAAALAAAARVSAAWYVSPQKFDHERFTEGVSDTNCFDLRLGD